MSDREEFESWYKREFGRAPTVTGYESDITWRAWQAAREQTSQECEGATVRWIDAEDRLPESEPDTWSHPVIALADNFEIFELSCMGNYWQRSKAFVDSGAEKVICWIPLPKLPED
jgi:hypothetical protein